MLRLKKNRIKYYLDFKKVLMNIIFEAKKLQLLHILEKFLMLSINEKYGNLVSLIPQKYLEI